MRQRLSASHVVPFLHVQASRLQMHVIGKLTATQVERDCVSRNCFQRNRHSRVERFAVSGDVIGEAISCRDNTAVGNCQHCFPIRIIGAHVPRVARK